MAAYVFHVPPGWPPAPAGWVPPEGWQPDPSWPPAPAGWVWWLAIEPALGPGPQSVADVVATDPLPVHDEIRADATGVIVASPSAGELSPSPTAAPKLSWSERRAVKHSERERTKALATWQVEDDLLVRAAGLAHRLVTGDSVSTGLFLKNGEIALWSGTAQLVEPRRPPGHYQGASQGMSFKIAKGVRYRVGATRGTFVPGDEVQSVVDSGSATVTNRRVVFTGGKATREWAYEKFVGMETSNDRSLVLLHVSNRQKVSGIKTPGHGLLIEAVNVALAVVQNDNSTHAVAAAISDELARHESEKP